MHERDFRSIRSTELRFKVYLATLSGSLGLRGEKAFFLVYRYAFFSFTVTGMPCPPNLPSSVYRYWPVQVLM
jgi:hypothetical protein